MADTQMLMNGFMRMSVDNAALSGNLLIEVDETNLVPGQSMDIYPGRVFRDSKEAQANLSLAPNSPMFPMS